MGSSASQPVPGAAPTGFNAASVVMKVLISLVGLVILLLAALFIYNAVAMSTGKPGTSILGSPTVPDQAPLPLDGKTKKVIAAANAPITQGADNSVQFWMYIKDWDYQFGEKKSVLYRQDTTHTTYRNPDISLHPTDNSLDVTVSLFPTDASDTSSTGDSYTCTVENVPLQTWFSVSVAVFQRNLDVYINGKLVKSCVLPGVPRPAAGDIIIGDALGFSGSVCNVHAYPNMITPSDASAFFSAGTNCSSFAQPGSTNTATNGSSMTLFGYTFTFAVRDSSGRVVQSSSF
jgi:Concanavalin A-like lectin/glucanases superfamily